VLKYVILAPSYEQAHTWAMLMRLQRTEFAYVTMCEQLGEFPGVPVVEIGEVWNSGPYRTPEWRAYRQAVLNPC
jgi:hypothetical protein